jgi:hypothetical protein
MRRIQRRKYAELADIIKRVVADSTVPEMLQALPVIEACDAFLLALDIDVLDEEISNGFLAAIDHLMQSGTAISQHPEVLQAAQAARALNDFTAMDELHALRDALAGELNTIYRCHEENGFFPDICLPGAGEEPVRVRMPDGEIVTLRARIVRPFYADDGSLDRCEYRGILTVLTRRLQFVEDCIEREVLVHDTVRSEWYALEGDPDFPNQRAVEVALNAAAALVGTDQEGLLFRRALGDLEIAADVEVIVSDESGSEVSRATFNRHTLANLPRVQRGDTFRFNFRGQPPAGILIFESDADASVFTGYGGAAACDAFIVALHGVVKKTDRYFVRRLLDCPAMRGKRVRAITDLDGGGLKFINYFANGRADRVLGAQRMCLTHQQVEAEIDRRVRRPLETVSNVRRFLNSNDNQIRQDAEYITENRHGAHVAFLQYPPPGSARRPGKLGMCLYLQDLVTEHLQR